MSFVWALLWLTAPTLHSQTGEFLLSHQNPRLKNVDNINFEMAIDKNGLLCVANRNGVLKFDGVMWDFFPTPSAVFSLAVDPANTLFVATRDGFGKIVTNVEGKVVYQSLSDEAPGSTGIFKVIVVEDHAYFLNEKHLYSYSLLKEKIDFQCDSEEYESFSALFEYKGKILIDEEVQGILEIQGDSLVKSYINTPDGALVQFSSKHPNEEKYLVGTTANNLFFMEGGELKALELPESSILNENEINSGLWYSDDLIVIGTIRQGCVFINPTSGETLQIVNYHTGLPDNEVFTLAQDLDGGVWVAHEFGFSRIAPNLPIRSLAHYPGLEGNLLAVQTYNDRLYVATSLGVYYLDEIKNYKEIVYYVKKRARTTTRQATTVKPTPSQPSLIQETPAEDSKKKPKKKKKKGLFNFLKKHKSPVDESKPPPAQDEGEKPKKKKKRGIFGAIFGKKKVQETPAEKKIEYERRIHRELQSIRFVYKSVPGIEAKCKQFVPFKDRLLIASNAGIYELPQNQDSSAILISNHPIRYLFRDSARDYIWFSTLNDEMKIFQLEDEVWQDLDLLPFFNEYVQHINMDADHNIWLVGSEEAYQLTLFENDSIASQTYKIKNQFYDEVYAIMMDGQPHFVNSSAFLVYDSIAQTIKDDSDLLNKYRFPNKYVFNAPDLLWIFDGKVWKWLGDRIPIQPQLEYLSLFKDLSHLSFDPQSNKLWIITAKNELYWFDVNKTNPYLSNHHLFLKSIKDQQGLNLSISNLSLKQENSHVIFEFTQPDYLGFTGLEYQYKLEGLNKNWSNWSANSSISFHYLPPGKYKLLVRARNSFDQVQEIDPYTFKVIPPIWKRWWFYLGEILFFGSLLLFTARLNRIRHRFGALSRVLTFMTIILTVEFLQTLVEANLAIKSSPIVDFFIEASIAFTILPIERILRTLMVKKKFKKMFKKKKSEA